MVATQLGISVNMNNSDLISLPTLILPSEKEVVEKILEEDVAFSSQ